MSEGYKTKCHCSKIQQNYGVAEIQLLQKYYHEVIGINTDEVVKKEHLCNFCQGGYATV